MESIDPLWSTSSRRGSEFRKSALEILIGWWDDVSDVFLMGFVISFTWTIFWYARNTFKKSKDNSSCSFRIFSVIKSHFWIKILYLGFSYGIERLLCWCKMSKIFPSSNTPSRFYLFISLQFCELKRWKIIFEPTWTFIYQSVPNWEPRKHWS